MLRRLIIKEIPIIREKIAGVIIGRIAALELRGVMANPLKLFVVICCD
jgi:hypothetical protein